MKAKPGPQAQPVRTTGTLSSWNDERGFGFIQPDDSSERLFAHIKDFTYKGIRPVPGMALQYAEGADVQGRKRATEVRAIGVKIPRQKRPGSGIEFVRQKLRLLRAVGLAAGFYAAVFWASQQQLIHPFIIWGYAVLGLGTFVIYGIDKYSAKRQAQREPEAHLHLLSLLGGWPGALIARHLFRHKTQKQPFRFYYWLTVIINCAALVLLGTEWGRAFLATQLNL